LSGCSSSSGSVSTPGSDRTLGSVRCRRSPRPPRRASTSPCQVAVESISTSDVPSMAAFAPT
jgi:hypothetical protein